MRILVLFLLLEILVLLILQCCPFLDLPLVFWPLWLWISKLILSQVVLHLNKLILNFTLFLLHMFSILPLRLVKASNLVTRWIRRRKKGRRRRRKINRGETMQPLIRIQIMLRNLLIIPTKLNPLASFVRAITF